MTIIQFYIVYNLIFISVLHFSTAIWWSIGYNDPVVSYKRLCSRFQNLGSSQGIICRKESDFSEEIMKGFGEAMKECGKQFRFQRWNCSMDKTSLRRTLKQDSKETAVLNAFAAAGITRSIADGCSRGKLTNCGCEMTTETEDYNMSPRNTTDSTFPLKVERIKENWKWNGCRNHLRFASQISRNIFGGKKEKETLRGDVRSIVRIHNNNVGRKVIKGLLQKKCKCHGLSGSCNFKTCSFKLPSMSRIGEALFQKYLQAVQVTSTNDGKELIPKESWETLRKEDLVFLEVSPNYCKRNIRKGSLGTKGRECNGTLTGNCDLLCCGRGFVTKIEEEIENCSCIFTFCCEVKCKKCKIQKKKSFCK
ncbi:UNVERIFIED_CONTAM: hypothetical protein RMT77_003528 [Armadillidium vulgare]